MESWEIEHIRNNCHSLVENTECSEALLTTLIKKNVISEEDKQEIDSKPDAEKSYKLYGTVIDRKGGYIALSEALAATKQTRAHRILQKRTGVSLLKRHKSVQYDKNYVLGRGVNSVVYKGWMGIREVAVKRLNRMSLVANKTIDIVSILNGLPAHSNVVQYFATYEKPEYLLIPSELCNGSLEDYIKDKVFPLDKREILRQATTGLGYLHANNIIHRNLKPSNVLMSITSGNVTLVKISDIGLTNTIDYQRPSSSASAFNWTPPEILIPCDEDSGLYPPPEWTLKSDVFPLGCIYCYVITEGKHPFGSAFRININILEGKYTLPDDDGGLMVAFRPLVKKMICSDPAERPACEEILLNECFVPLLFRQSSQLDLHDTRKENTGPEPATAVGISSNYSALKTAVAATKSGSKLQSNTNDGREAEISSGGPLARDLLVKVGTKITAEKTKEEDVPKTPLMTPQEVEPGRKKSMRTWQRYYIWTISGELHQDVVNKEKILNELFRSNMLSKIEAAQIKDFWPKFYYFRPLNTSPAEKLLLFEVISRRGETYELLMAVLRNTGNSKQAEKLKDGQSLVQEFPTDDSFLQACYAIAMHRDVEPPIPNLNALRGKDGESLLHVAAGCGHVPMIHKLHSMGMDTSCQDEDGNYPHHYLGKWSSNVIEVTKALLAVGTDISTKNKRGETVAHAVAVNISSPVKFHDWCQFMIEINMEKLLIENNVWQQSSLHYAVTCFEVLEKTLLLMKENGLSLSQRDGVSRGLAFYAVWHGRTKTTIEAFIKCGVDWNYSDKHGKTVLHLAVEGGNIEAVEYFLNLVANVNAKDTWGRTPLHFLRDAYVNHVEITKLLVSKGAKLTVVDVFGDLPAHDLYGNWGKRREEYREWTKYLLKSGLVTERYFRQKNNTGKLPLPPH